MRAVDIPTSGDNEALIAHLWDLGTVGIIENPDALTAFFSEDTDLSALIETYPCYLTHVSEDASATQVISSQAEIDPILAGNNFVISSSSNPAVPPTDRILITIDAQNAFGSGSHESTQLVIAALEERVRTNLITLDVGSGSGILSAVAQHLGANKIFACDTHLDSVRLTRHHAPGVAAFVGSVDAVSSNSVDLVVANISTRVIDALSGHLNRVAKPNGWLILSGFIADNPPHSFFPASEMSLDEWRCWICKPSKTAGTTADATISLQPFASEWW